MTKPLDDKPISLKFRQDTAVIRFERPESKNPLSTSVLRLLEEELAVLNAESECCTIVFTGTGNTFAAGANLNQVAKLNSETAYDFGRFGQRVFGLIRDSPKRTIAAINGYCIGGALDLALSCDSRIATPEAVFAHPGVRLGIITGWGGTQMLPSLIGRKNAYQMFLTAARIGAKDALSIGLIDEIADEPLERAVQISGGGTMRKLITGWILVKAAAVALFAVITFSAGSPLFSKVPTPTPTPTPVATPTVDDSIDRPTSDPYTGNLARFDRENRAEKLQIDRIMDILGMVEGSAVADIGAGGGWFSAIASKRVGKDGKVFAVDISQDSVDYINKRIENEKLDNIETALSTADHPNLKEKSVDAVLILNTYHEIAEPVKFLRNLKVSLKANALVGIIDREGKGDDHGIDQEVVKLEAARVGLTFVKSYDFVNKDRMDYFIVFSNK